MTTELDAGRTRIGNTPTCETCHQPLDHCTCGDDESAWQPIECCACAKRATLDENGVTDDKWVYVSRGLIAAQDAEGLATAGELADKENIKFSRYICEHCFLTDPDLCAFFNRCGLRIR